MSFPQRSFASVASIGLLTACAPRLDVTTATQLAARNFSTNYQTAERIELGTPPAILLPSGKKFYSPDTGSEYKPDLKSICEKQIDSLLRKGDLKAFKEEMVAGELVYLGRGPTLRLGNRNDNKKSYDLFYAMIERKLFKAESAVNEYRREIYCSLSYNKDSFRAFDSYNHEKTADSKSLFTFDILRAKQFEVSISDIGTDVVKYRYVTFSTEAVCGPKDVFSIIAVNGTLTPCPSKISGKFRVNYDEASKEWKL